MPSDKRRRGTPPPPQISPRLPELIAAVYLLAGLAWIAFDRTAATLLGSYATFRTVQIYKGWVFVTASALVILVVLKWAWRSLLAAYDASSESERRLELALTSAGGGIWEMDLTRHEETVIYVSGELLRRLGLPSDHQFTMAEMRGRLHPDDSEETNRRLNLAISSGGRQPYDVRYRLRCAEGVYRWVHARGNVVAGPDGKPQRMVGVALDIDEQVKAEERIGQLLRYDPVTGLSRQSKFLADLKGILGKAASGRWLAVVQLKLVDLDRLIADAETAEDAAIVRLVGDRLHALPGMLAARIASDVFALATDPTATPAEAQRLVRTALEHLLKPLQMPNGSVRLRVQTGGALGVTGAETAIGLLRNSGHALDLANPTPAVAVRWFSQELRAEVARRADRIRGLERAVPNREIECHYQPLVDLRTGRTVGFEALARWRRPSGGLVLPSSFIPLAEEIGKIGEIGEEVLRQACRTAATWPLSLRFVAVNVSPLQLEDPGFVELVTHILGKTGLPATRLELEITETALLRDEALALERIAALRERGILVAIDDFGTGYSSLALLNRMPFTRLKIDRAFVSGSGNSREDMIIVDMIIDLAHKLGLSITAEGVETAEQARMLAEKGVDLGQGFHFSPPVAAADVAALAARTWSIAPGVADDQPRLRLAQ